MGGSSRNCFFYVPTGKENKIEVLLEGNGVDYDGIRCYTVTHQNLKITPYITRNDEYDHTVT